MLEVALGEDVDSFFFLLPLPLPLSLVEEEEVSLLGVSWFTFRFGRFGF